MTRRGAGRGRSRREWAFRLGLAAIAAWFGWNAATHSLATALRESAPERAHQLAPYNGRITAILSAKWILDPANPARQAEAERFAKQALLRDPTAVLAVVTLGLAADQRGDAAAARRLFTYSERLSRRDMTTQIWAIEDSVARNDIAGALRHYDIALRTTYNAPELLFPVLVNAIDDPTIRIQLTRTLAARPAWGPAFVDHVAVGGSNPRATASLFTSLNRAGLTVSESAQTALIGALAAKGDYDAAWSYYASVRPSADRRRSRDPRFTSTNDSPSQFDWQAMNDVGITTAIQRGDDVSGHASGVFDFAAPANVGGQLLRQLQLLPAGRYVLTGRSAGIDQPEASRPYWALTCLDGRELGRVVVPTAARGDGRFGGRFIVPVDCPAQYLSLVARPSDAVSGVSGQIEEAALRPAE